MAPGGPPRAQRARNATWEINVAPAGASKIVSGGHLGSLLAPLGAVLALPEGPREAPGEAPRGHFGGHFCSRALRHEQSKKQIFSRFLDCLFGCFLNPFLRLPGGAGASAHLEKTAFRMEGVAFFACPAFARGSNNFKK